MSGDPGPTDLDLLALLDAGDIDSTLDRIDSALEGADTFQRYTLLLARGRLQLARGEPDRALPDLTEALSLAATSAEQGQALLARGEAALEAARPDDARHDLNASLTLLVDPLDRAEANRLLARLDLANGHIDAALKRLSRTVTDLSVLGDAGDVRAEISLDLAQALRLAGEIRPARAVLEELLVWAGDRMGWVERVRFQLGTTFAFGGRYDLAIAQYSLALELQQDAHGRALSLYNRAVAYRELRDLGSAQRDLSAALEENGNADQRLAWDAQLLGGVIAREQADMPASLELLRQAVDCAPNGDAQGRTRLEIGVTLAATGIHGLAAEEFGAAIALCTDDLDRERAYRYRATARREMGLPALALDDVTHALALTLEPDERARGAMTRAALLCELDREAEAYAALCDAPYAEVENEDVRVQLAFQLGSLATRRGEIDVALSNLGEAVRMARARADNVLLAQALVNRGVALDVTGAEDEAIESFREVVRLAPSAELVYQARMNLGRVHTDHARIPQALEAFGFAAAAADDRDARAMAFLSRGSAAMRSGRYVEADADFTRVLVLQPSGPIATQARYYRGLTASLLGQLDRARADLTVTIDLERDRDNRAQALLDRGLIALSAGDFDGAERDLREAAASFRRRERRAEAHVQLAIMYALQGNCAASAESLREAKTLDPSGAATQPAAEDPRLRGCRDDASFAATGGADV